MKTFHSHVWIQNRIYKYTTSAIADLAGLVFLSTRRKYLYVALVHKSINGVINTAWILISNWFH